MGAQAVETPRFGPSIVCHRERAGSKARRRGPRGGLGQDAAEREREIHRLLASLAWQLWPDC